MKTEPDPNQGMDKPKSPRKKKRVSKKTPEEQLIADALESCLGEYKERKKVSQDNIEIVSSVIEEYLQNFLIVGYNYDGEMLAYTSAKTQLQVDALNTGLQKYIIQNIQRGHQPPGMSLPPGSHL